MRLLESKSPQVQACARKLLQPTTAAPAPAAATVEEAAIVTDFSFAPLNLGAELRGERGWSVQAPSHWISAGPDVDLCWATSVLYRMHGNGRLDKIWEFDESGNLTWFTSVVFDGRNLWIAATQQRGPFLLFVLDPQTGKAIHFRAEDGLPVNRSEDSSLPNHNDVLRLVALEPGRVCAIGYIGRTYCATATLSPEGKKSVRVFFEARGAANPEDVSQETDPTVTFEPGFTVLLQGPHHEPSNPQRRIVVGRKSRSPHVLRRPILVDPDREVVTAAAFDLYGSTPEREIATVNDKMFFVERRPSSAALLQVAYPCLVRTEAVHDAPESLLLAVDDKLYLAGEKWWNYDLKTTELRVLANPVPWTVTTQKNANERPNRPGFVEQHHLWELEASQHLGIILVTAPRLGGDTLYFRAVRSVDSLPSKGLPPPPDNTRSPIVQPEPSRQ